MKGFCATCKGYFLLVIGDPGDPGTRHASGILPDIAADYHKKEIESNFYESNPYEAHYGRLPHFEKGKDLVVIKTGIRTVSELNDYFGKFDRIKYFAFFGHSSADGIDGSTRKPDGDYDLYSWGCLHLSMSSVEGGNLGIHYYNAYSKGTKPVSDLPNLKANMEEGGQIRLFACRSGATIHSHDLKEYIYEAFTKPYLAAKKVGDVAEMNRLLKIINHLDKAKPYSVAKQFSEFLPDIEVWGGDGAGDQYTEIESLGHGEDRNATDTEQEENIKAAARAKKDGRALWLVPIGKGRGWVRFVNGIRR